VDTDTRRKKQQALMTELLERKIRLHAQHLYDQRGQGEGHALQDWVQAEATVLENSVAAPLYRKAKSQDRNEDFCNAATPQTPAADCSGRGAAAN
jgi:hypothetical protein